jgi:hypothetical protein
MRDEKHGCQQADEQQHAQAERFECFPILLVGSLAPIGKIAAILIEQHAGLVQRRHDRGRLLEQPRERVVLIARAAQSGTVRRLGLRRQRVAAIRQTLQLIERRRANGVERLLQLRRTLVDLGDRGPLGRKPEDRGCQVPDTEPPQRAADHGRRVCRQILVLRRRYRRRRGYAARGGDRSGNRIDVRLERIRTEARRISFVRELRHVRQHVAPGVHEVQLALQHRNAGLQSRSLLLRRARQLALVRLDLGLNRRALIVELLARAAQRLLGGGLLRFLSHTRLAAQQLGVGACEVEGQLHDLVGGLAVRIQEQQVARLRGRLLLGAERAVPVDGLVENLHDLIARHHGPRVRRGGGRLRRRVRGLCGEHGDACEESCYKSYAHGGAIL